MYLLTEAEISHLNKFGYVVCETGLEGSQVLLDAQRQYKKLYKLTEDGGYPYFRIYFDYSGKKNISGIEMPFHPEIINKEIVAFLNASNLARGVKDVLGEGEISMSLSRYHMTGNRFGFVGSWHRDGNIGDTKQLQANISLFDERSLEVIPGSHIKEMPGVEGLINEFAQASSGQSLHLKCKAGNIVFFNPAILHRGFSYSFRANMHFRFSLSSNCKTSKFDNALGFSQDWVDILSNKNSIIVDQNLKIYIQRKGYFYSFRKFLKTLASYVFFFMPYNFILFRKLPIRPNLRFRGFFKKQS
jgi:hypothetical protein